MKKSIVVMLLVVVALSLVPMFASAHCDLQAQPPHGSQTGVHCDGNADTLTGQAYVRSGSTCVGGRGSLTSSDPVGTGKVILQVNGERPVSQAEACPR